MKLVSYVVVVPEHHAVLMHRMGEILTDFETVESLGFVQQVLQDAEAYPSPFANVLHNVFVAWSFDTEAEQQESEAQIIKACQAFIEAEERERAALEVIA